MGANYGKSSFPLKIDKVTKEKPRPPLTKTQRIIADVVKEHEQEYWKKK